MAKLSDIRSLGNQTDRIVRLESNYETLRDEVESVHAAVDAIGNRLDREFQRIRESSRPNYAVWVSIAGLTITMFFGVGAAAYVPVWITTNNINDKAQSALNLSHQHTADIATQSTKFTEVETQFRGVNNEVQTQIENNKNNVERQDMEVMRLRDRTVGLMERTSKVEQRLDDHDKYLWPIQQKSVTFGTK